VGSAFLSASLVCGLHLTALVADAALTSSLLIASGPPLLSGPALMRVAGLLVALNHDVLQSHFIWTQEPTRAEVPAGSRLSPERIGIGSAGPICRTKSIRRMASLGAAAF
jgi:hypothetical protein